MKTYENLNQLKNTKSVCLIAHIEPDPDALASMVVFRDFLKSYFKIKKVDIFAEHQSMSDNLKEILETVKINPNCSNYETAIMMDCPNTDRLGIYKPLFEQAKHKIVIDHHATNNNDGEINIVDICSSTCEIVYSIIKYFRYQLSTAQQGKLYAGIITDTNNFSVGAIKNRTFEIVGEFAENIDREAIYKAFLANNTQKSMQLLSIAIQNIVSFEHGQIIITHITLEDAERHKAQHIDMCGIVNQIASINSAKLICFIEPRNNKYYVSMRAKRGYDVSQIAKSNGGGGHIGAAAYISDKSLKETEQQILQDFRENLSNVKPVTVKIFK